MHGFHLTSQKKLIDFGKDQFFFFHSQDQIYIYILKKQNKKTQYFEHGSILHFMFSVITLFVQYS